MFYNVSFRWYDTGTYCTNIASAASEADVIAHYAGREIVSITPASDYDVQDARRRGKPVVVCGPAPVAAAADQDSQLDQDDDLKKYYVYEAYGDGILFVSDCSADFVRQLCCEAVAACEDGGVYDLATAVKAAGYLYKSLYDTARDGSCYGSEFIEAIGYAEKFDLCDFM